jgi:hypothetical protein
MGQISGLNGEQLGPYEVRVTMDRDTLKVTIDTEVKDIDTTINMLATALRFLDVQYRIAAGMQAQEQYRQHQKQMSIAAAMLKDGAIRQ